ncbi:MAG: hypothetical protein RLZZ136_971 [Pseudomonadota bacterium]|jgi:peptidyl-prolyl cis-trans isomerase D
MLHFFRSFMKSKIGVGLTLAFVGLMALAFASGDILSFGNVAAQIGGTNVATAGSRTISASSLDFFARRALEQARQKDPRLNMRGLVAAGGLEQVLDGLLDNAAASAFGAKVGIVAGNRLVGSELAKEPGFRGNTGNFDDTTYRAAIGRQGFTDTVYRQLIGDELVSQQLQIPAAFGAKVPNELVNRYAALLTETRQGSIALLPSIAFAPKTEPSADELAKFYAAHRSAYVRPERRIIRYISFDDSALKGAIAPTEAEIAAKYNADKAKYAPSETRKLTQMVVPTQAAAQAILADVAKGISLDQAARAKKLATATIAPISQDAYSAQSAPAVANAVFTGAQGKITGPVKGGLGWYLVRVDAVQRNPGKSLAQARGEIITALAAAKKRTALVDFSEKIEGEFDEGGALSDVAKELGLEIKQTELLTADGKVFGKPDQTVAPELARIVQTAFLMDQEGQPQLAEAVPGKTFVAFDVGTIQQSAAAPLVEIRQQVLADFLLDKGAAAAQQSATTVLAATRKGTDLSAAVSALGLALPPVDKITMNRSQLARLAQSTPPPLSLLFNMAQGTTKLLPAPGNRGWYLVSLKTIIPGKIDPRDPVLTQASSELGTMAGREYAEQMRRAIRADLGAKTNDAAIKTLAKQLVGNN